MRNTSIMRQSAIVLLLLSILYHKSSGFTRMSRSLQRYSPSIIIARPEMISNVRSKILQSTNDDDDQIPVRTPNLGKLYQLGQYICSGMAVVLFGMPDRTLFSELATKMSASAGFGIAAGLCYLMMQAAKFDQLSTDTYKRLNIGLLLFAVGGLLAVPGEAGFCNRFAPSLIMLFIMTGVRSFITYVSFLGLKKAVAPGESLRDSLPLLKNEILQGSKLTMQGLVVQDKKKAMTYRNCLLILFFGIFSTFMDFLFNIRYQAALNRNWFDISLKWSAVSRLSMIATLVYSLKDAAERDRLTKTTFVALNIMVGAWSMLVGIGQSIDLFGFAIHRGVEMYAFALPFLLQALKSTIERNEQEFFK